MIIALVDCALDVVEGVERVDVVHRADAQHAARRGAAGRRGATGRFGARRSAAASHQRHEGHRRQCHSPSPCVLSSRTLLLSPCGHRLVGVLLIVRGSSSPAGAPRGGAVVSTITHSGPAVLHGRVRERLSQQVPVEKSFHTAVEVDLGTGPQKAVPFGRIGDVLEGLAEPAQGVDELGRLTWMHAFVALPRRDQ